LSGNFPIQNRLKRGDTLSQLLFNFALEYAIRKIQENHEGMKSNETHQFLAYAYDVSLLGVNRYHNKTKGPSTDANKEVELEGNLEKIKYLI
jgi:hypothetical protein